MRVATAQRSAFRPVRCLLSRKSFSCSWTAVCTRLGTSSKDDALTSCNKNLASASATPCERVGRATCLLGFPSSWTLSKNSKRPTAIHSAIELRHEKAQKVQKSELQVTNRSASRQLTLHSLKHVLRCVCASTQEFPTANLEFSILKRPSFLEPYCAPLPVRS